MLLSGTPRGLAAARPLSLRQQGTITHVPICAAKSTDGQAKTPKTPRKRRARKATSTEPASADPTTPPPLVAGRSLHRLHSTSDTLRALLERRAERQQRQMSSAGTSMTPPLAARPAAPLAPIPEPPAQRNRVKVRFWLNYRVDYGQNIVLVGGHPDIGSWILADGVPLSWSDGDMWNATVDLPAGSVIEYKYVVVGYGGHAVAWQQGNNSVLALRQSDDVVEVYDNWTCAPGAQVVAAGSAPVTRENRLLSWATELEAQVASQRQELRRARMELVAAQEEARLAREESRKLKMALSQSEAERMATMANLKQAETVNHVLQTQLVETTSSFAEALETALDLLGANPTANGNGNGKKATGNGSKSTSTAAPTTSTSGARVKPAAAQSLASAERKV